MVEYVGNIVKGLIILLGVCIVISGQLAGLLIIIPALLVDWFIAAFGIKATSSFSNAIKVLLLIQALLVWLVIQSQNNAMQIFSRPLNPPSVNNILYHKQFKMTEPQVHPVVVDDQTETPDPVRDIRVRQAAPSIKDLLPARDGASLKAASAFISANQYNDPYNTSTFIHPLSRNFLVEIFDGAILPDVKHADLVYRSPEAVRNRLKNIFDEVPTITSFSSDTESSMSMTVPVPNTGFDKRFKNPCFTYDPEIYLGAQDPVRLSDHFDNMDAGRIQWSDAHEKAISARVDNPAGHETAVACLPFAYLLGQPKCGTSDMFERLRRHQEIRWVIDSVLVVSVSNFNTARQREKKSGGSLGESLTRLLKRLRYNSCTALSVGCSLPPNCSG
jgi:hypothetical protein